MRDTGSVPLTGTITHIRGRNTGSVNADKYKNNTQAQVQKRPKTGPGNASFSFLCISASENFMS